MASNTVTNCCAALIRKNWTIAIAESASAGKMSYAFSTVPESGKILIGGMVCYNSCMKEAALGVAHELIEKYTAESAEVTQAMAQNFHKINKADVCVALTGLTSPGGSETPEKPIGTIVIHAVLPNRELARRFEFNGTPGEIVDQAIDAAAALVLSEINNNDKY